MFPLLFVKEVETIKPIIDIETYRNFSIQELFDGALNNLYTEGNEVGFITLGWDEDNTDISIIFHSPDHIYENTLMVSIAKLKFKDSVDYNKLEDYELLEFRTVSTYREHFLEQALSAIVNMTSKLGINIKTHFNMEDPMLDEIIKKNSLYS